MTIYIIMTSFKRLVDKYGAEVCKNICLQKCNQNFNKINEYNKRYRQRRETPANKRIQCTKNEDQGYKANDDDMPC